MQGPRISTILRALSRLLLFLTCFILGLKLLETLLMYRVMAFSDRAASSSFGLFSLWIPQTPSVTNAIEISDMRKGTGCWVKKATGK
ncbi:MAG: hypothetical protein DMG36_03500 [Acidobacteria bacterium]|nr:MAG: hypothetical protein DMG36_03500 [Acidobacteriota bacterium]